MKLSKYDIASILLIVVLFAVSIYLYPSLPDKIPTHWNAAGEVDGWGSSGTIFMFPAIIFLIYGLLLILPKIAVFKENIKGFKHFESMKFVLVLFFSIMYGATMLPNYGYDTINMSKVILPLIGLLFLYFGYILPSAKRNFFIGIRTPWTLASDEVWEKTHKLGGKAFLLCGVLMFLSFFLSAEYFVWFILAIVLGMVFVLFGYSYWLWNKTGRNKKL